MSDSTAGNVVTMRPSTEEISGLKEYTNLKADLVSAEVKHTREVADLKIQAVIDLDKQYREINEKYNEKLVDLNDRYYERILVEKDKALSAALATAKEAVAVAEKNAEKWRDNANEWRGAMNDKDKNLMQRTEFATFKDGYEKAMDEMKETGGNLKGRREGLDNIRAWIPVILAIAGILVAYFIGKGS